MARQKHYIRQHFTIVKHSASKETGTCIYCNQQIGFSVLRGTQHLKKCENCPQEVLLNIQPNTCQITMAFYDWVKRFNISFDSVNNQQFKSFIYALNETWTLPDATDADNAHGRQPSLESGISIDQLIN